MRQSRTQQGPKAIAALVGKSSRAALVRRGFAEADILNQWGSIVGPNLAEVSSPEKLGYTRQSNREATLRIRVAPGWAPEFQHFEPLIIERVNSFFGYKAVARLQLIQAPVKKNTPPKRIPPTPLTDAEKQWIEASVAKVTDEELKQRLIAVGTALLQARR
ncbi:MAG: hypothetical protein CMN55_05750 [Sneathiella sp.]|jgi:hypothetical protein|uniref:DUF721 domain-containing protein n=1 Tax=Sneathiella sp. TaxID=1964365 RepID=UPI000C5A5132|nr:DciA family protein [Sneathiella sp.]MAL78604.1 hypothetical protein [Sneathiella sp.]